MKLTIALRPVPRCYEWRHSLKKVVALFVLPHQKKNEKLFFFPENTRSYKMSDSCGLLRGIVDFSQGDVTKQVLQHSARPAVFGVNSLAFGWNCSTIQIEKCCVINF
jgi:hypothetical protein